MYVCMSVCLSVCLSVCMLYICTHTCTYVNMFVCMYVWMDGWMDGWMDVCMYVCIISLPMCTVEGSSTKRVLTLPPYSPTVGIHSVRQLHVGASRLSLVFVSDASGEGITCSCVAPCTLCTSCALGYGRSCLRPRSPCSRSCGGYNRLKRD